MRVSRPTERKGMPAADKLRKMGARDDRVDADYRKSQTLHSIYRNHSDAEAERANDTILKAQRGATNWNFQYRDLSQTEVLEAETEYPFEVAPPPKHIGFRTLGFPATKHGLLPDFSSADQRFPRANDAIYSTELDRPASKTVPICRTRIYGPKLPTRIYNSKTTPLDTKREAKESRALHVLRRHSLPIKTSTLHSQTYTLQPKQITEHRHQGRYPFFLKTPSRNSYSRKYSMCGKPSLESPHRRLSNSRQSRRWQPYPYVKTPRLRQIYGNRKISHLECNLSPMYSAPGSNLQHETPIGSWIPDENGRKYFQSSEILPDPKFSTSHAPSGNPGKSEPAQSPNYQSVRKHKFSVLNIAANHLGFEPMPDAVQRACTSSRTSPKRGRFLKQILTNRPKLGHSEACKICRSRKVRCSKERPCKHCVRRKESCD